MRWETKGQSAQGVQYKAVTSPSSLKCVLSFATETLQCFCWTEHGGPESQLPVVSISPSKHVLVSSVSSHFLEDLLNEASASSDMQQTYRKASCGRCPWDELDPYLGSQLQRGLSGSSAMQLQTLLHWLDCL